MTIAFLAVVVLGAHRYPALAREHGAARDTGTITTIVVHAVGGPACVGKRIIFRPIPFRADDAVFWHRFLTSAPVADAHFVIGRSGKVEPVLPVTEVAHHVAGANDASIGIELVHRGDGAEPFDPRQIRALIALIKRLRHDLPKITPDNVLGHSDLDQRTCLCGGVAFRRRQDPGANFPWLQVRAAIRPAGDPPRGKPSTVPLVGPAVGSACPVE